MANKVKAICFDLDGVYFTPQGKQGFHKNLLKLTKKEEAVIDFLYECPEMLAYVTGKMPEKKFWDFARQKLQLELSNDQFVSLWIQDYQIDKTVREALLKLKKQGYIICTCSNNNPSRIRGLSEKFDFFLDDFDVKIFSYEVGEVKPNKNIFKTLIDQCGCEPEEIIYSDDNPKRIQGAADLGIQTFVYEDFEQFIYELEQRGVEIENEK